MGVYIVKHPNPKKAAEAAVIAAANMTGERFELKAVRVGDEIMVTAVNPKTEQALTGVNGRAIREPYRPIVGA